MLNIFAGGEGRRKDEILAGLATASRKLISDINESLRYYLIERRAAGINKVYLCGGFSLVNGMKELLSSQINCPVEMWNPFSKINSSNTEMRNMLNKNGSAFVVAAGLAMRSI